VQALSVDPVAGRVIVTCKKSLVSSDLPVITSFEDAEPGVQSHGYISSVKVRALLPRCTWPT
jgi:rRNA biogenesis protein RRP5